MNAPEDPARKAKIKRPVVSDRDGTREGGLVFCIALMAGMVLAASLAPGALTSFWVWIGLLAMAVALAVNVQVVVAHMTGFRAEQDDDDTD